MKIFSKQTVLEAALERIRYIFDEFPNVVVGYSGGKDSTVTLRLALQVAEEKGRLPLPVVWLDQEAEWESVVEHVREVMNDPRVKPLWVQVPFKIFNATSQTDRWLHAWAPDERDIWMRPQEPNNPWALDHNPFGTERFSELFTKMLNHWYPDEPACYLGGMRAEESPTRYVALSSTVTWRWVTWGKVLNRKKDHYTFYPIYDWSFSDVWKAIHDHKWSYTRIYDAMWQHGVDIRNMRVSNLHHETAIHQLFNLQEIEPQTWEKLVRRLPGIGATTHIGKASYMPTELPPMFKTWKEYRDHLVDNLVQDEEQKARFRHRFAALDETYKLMADISVMHRIHVNTVIINDWEGIKINNWERTPDIRGFYQWSKGKYHHTHHKNKHIPQEAKEHLRDPT